MIEGWMLWAALVVIAIGGIVAGVALVRLPRAEDDVSAVERPFEAAWIAATIERNGGIAPQSLVEEVLDLHQAYLNAPRAPRRSGLAAPSGPPPPAGHAPPPAGYAPPPPGPPPPGPPPQRR